jgi:hypothetical protein
MTDLWNDISTWTVLKWVILVLVAAFIGQFGKTLAQAIIGKVRERRTRKPAGAGAETPEVDPAPVPPPLQMPQEKASPDGRPPDKKTLKTLAKMQKKAAKKR